MELVDYRCTRCGGELSKGTEAEWKCDYCGMTYYYESARQNTEKLKELLSEEKREMIFKIRRNLYDSVTAEYISSEQVIHWCRELKKLLPDDFMAEFYEIAASDNAKKINAYIREIDVEKHYGDMDIVIEFLIRSLQSEYLLEVNHLIERTYKRKDLSLFEKYATALSVEAQKVQNGVYETMLPRDVFVAYSAKDMKFVSKLVEVLESQGMSCFVSARNLRHGKGSVENYDQALKDAMDNCKTFVFVSSMNSRSLSCDALKIEIPYVKGRDISNAPPQYRNNYISIPHIYKKPRVEYRIKESKGYNVADEVVKEFFDGYEWALSCEEVARRVMDQLIQLNSNRTVAVETEEEIPPVRPKANTHDAMHVHSYTSKVVEATCISRGYTVHTCSCGDQYKDNYTALAEHSYTDWVNVKRPTCEENGVEHRRCSACGNDERRDIPATGHSFGSWQEHIRNGRSIGEVRVCRNCGMENTRSHADKIEKSSGSKTLLLTLFWLCFSFCLFGALFMGENVSLFKLIIACSPLGMAFGQEDSALNFAVITMTVCAGLAYLLNLVVCLSSGDQKASRGGLKCLFLTAVSLVIWYVEYAFCFVLIRMDGIWFYIWTIVIELVLNTVIVFVITAAFMDRVYPIFNEPQLADDNDRAVYLRWRKARAWMFIGVLIGCIGMMLTLLQEDLSGFWNAVVPLVMFAGGILIILIGGINTISYSRNYGSERLTKKLITGGNASAMILSLTLAALLFALYVIVPGEEGMVAVSIGACLVAAFVFELIAWIVSKTPQKQKNKRR